MTSDSKKTFVLLGLVMLLFLFIRYMNGNYRLADSEEYLQTAHLLKTGDYFKKTTDIDQAAKLTVRPFLYPLFVALTGPAKDFIIVLVQTIAGLINLYLSLLLFEKLGGKKPFGMFLLLVLLTPSVFIYAHLMMSEIFVALLLLLISVMLTSTLTTRRIILIQILLTLLCFVKPVFYLFMFINILFWVGYFIKYKKLAAFSSIIPIILIFSYMSFNQYRTGYFHFSSIQSFNLIHYNLFYYKINQCGYTNAVKWEDSLNEKALQFKTFKSRSEFLINSGNHEIKNHLISYSMFQFIGGMRGIIDPGRFDIITFFHTSNEREGFLTLINSTDISYILKKIVASGDIYILLFLIPIGLMGVFKWFLIGRFFFINYKTITIEIIFLWILILYLIFITGPLNASRFMMPMQLILIPFAALGAKGLFVKRLKN